MSNPSNPSNPAPTFAQLDHESKKLDQQIKLALAAALAYTRGKAKLQAEREAWERDFHENPETQA